MMKDGSPTSLLNDMDKNKMITSDRSKVSNGPTHSELGVITERPNRKEYALRDTRLKTFANWSPSHQIKKEEMADAGFYYAGYSDSVRCFQCGLGLRNWCVGENAHVEHARRYPVCVYIRHRMGHTFVETVQELKETQTKITHRMVMERMGCHYLQNKADRLKLDPAVQILTEQGFDREKVVEKAILLRSKGRILTVDLLLSQLEEDEINSQGACCQAIRTPNTPIRSKEHEKLKEENEIMRRKTICKKCVINNVEIVFLPCGHLLTCVECGSALTDCPECGEQIKGTVRAFIPSH